MLGGVATEQHRLVEDLDRRVTDAMVRVRELGTLTEQLDRRHNQRVPATGSVRLTVHGRVSTGEVRDVGLGGLRVVAASAPPVGDVVEASLDLLGVRVSAPAWSPGTSTRPAAASSGCSSSTRRSRSWTPSRPTWRTPRARASDDAAPRSPG